MIQFLICVARNPVGVPARYCCGPAQLICDQLFNGKYDYPRRKTPPATVPPSDTRGRGHPKPTVNLGTQLAHRQLRKTQQNCDFRVSRSQSSPTAHQNEREKFNNNDTGKTRIFEWCWEGESIPTVFKGIVKITSILAKCNIDAGLRTISPH